MYPLLLHNVANAALCHPIHDAVVKEYGIFFYFLTYMFIFIVGTGNIVMEKESQLREYMRLAGLRVWTIFPSDLPPPPLWLSRSAVFDLFPVHTLTSPQNCPFWLSWFVQQFLLVLAATLVLVTSGAACQFNFFLKNNFGTYFFLFLLFGISITATSFMISTLVQKSRVASSDCLFFSSPPPFLTFLFLVFMNDTSRLSLL